MIRYVKRKNVNVLKYDACVEKSSQSSVYAFSWYLDIVADNWGVLVLDDYKVVMPLPWNSKFGLKYISQPYFCQQLNVYSEDDIGDEVFNKFMHNIPKYFVLFDINLGFNINNKAVRKQNYSLELNRDYITTSQEYRKDRKKSLRKATEANLKFEDFNNKNALVTLYKDVFDFLNMPEKYFNTIDKVIDYALLNNKGFVRNVFLKDELVCIGFFLKHHSKIYYVFAASSKKGKKYGATTYLLDSVIKEHSNTNYILDFEGSSIASIASFYKSFGSDLNYYFNYKSNVFKRVFL